MKTPSSNDYTSGAVKYLGFTICYFRFCSTTKKIFSGCVKLFKKTNKKPFFCAANIKLRNIKSNILNSPTRIIIAGGGLHITFSLLPCSFLLQLILV
jgi:hypothetical protein